MSRLRNALIAAALLWACPAQAAVTVVQAGAIDTAAYTAGVKTYVGLSALSTENLIICNVQNDNNRSFSSVTFGGQAMTQAPDTLIANLLAIYYRVVTGAEVGTSVIVTLSGTDTNNTAMACIGVAGASTDQSGIDGDTDVVNSDVQSVGPVTPATAANIIVAYASRGNRTWVNEGGWTDVGVTANTYTWVYMIQAAATPQSYDYSTGDGAATNSNAIAAFSGAGAASTCNGGMMTLGAGKSCEH